MYDDMPEEVDVFDFNEFADHLLDQGVLASPSLLHGCLSGLLGAGASQEPEYALSALRESLNLDLCGELASRVMQLYSVTAAALQDDDYVFHPLLPDDDEEIALRTAALASWCEGFLAGFAYRVAAVDTSAALQSGEVGEVLRDIAAMAQAEAGDYEDEEEAENNLSELVEYLRVAVMNVFMDIGARVAEHAESSKATRPLH
jgi:yecA family protein